MEMCSLICTLSVNHPQNFPPIGAFMELCSNANLPCLVNLALGVAFSSHSALQGCKNFAQGLEASTNDLVIHIETRIEKNWM